MLTLWEIADILYRSGQLEAYESLKHYIAEFDKLRMESEVLRTKNHAHLLPGLMAQCLRAANALIERGHQHEAMKTIDSVITELERKGP